MWSSIFTNATVVSSAFGLLLALGVALTLGGGAYVNLPYEYMAARVCYALAFSILLMRVGYWLAFERGNSTSSVVAIIVAGIIFGGVGVFWVLSSIWVADRERKLVLQNIPSADIAQKEIHKQLSEKEKYPFERITPAKFGESVVVVFKIHGPEKSADITSSIANALRAELEPGSLVGPMALISNWRIEQSGKMLPIDQATNLGRRIGALFVITGDQDGRTLSLELALTDPNFLIQNEEISAVGIRLDASRISLSIPLDQIPTQIVPIAVFLKGIHLYIIRQFDKASNYFGRVIDHSVQKLLTARAYYLRGICRGKKSQWDSAQKDFESALRLGLDVPAVHWCLAELFLRTAKGFSSVEKEIEKALQLSGYSAQSYHAAGWIIFQAMLRIPYAFADMPEFFDKADEYLRVSIEKDPAQLMPILTRVSLHLQYGEFLGRKTLQDVTCFLSYAIDRGGDRPEIRLAMADVYLRYHQGGDAVTHLDRALKLGASPGMVRLRLAEAYEQSGDTQQAIRNLKLFLSEKTKIPCEWWFRAIAKQRIARLEGDSTALLFKTVPESTAIERRQAFMNIALSWVGKIWNKEFLGERSTESLLLYFLTEAGILPKIPDKESAKMVMNSMLDDKRVEIERNTTPIYCQKGLWSGNLIVVSSGEGGDVKVIYLDPSRDGKVVEMKEQVELLGFFFECRRIRTDMVIAFSGD